MILIFLLIICILFYNPLMDYGPLLFMIVHNTYAQKCLCTIYSWSDACACDLLLLLLNNRDCQHLSTLKFLIMNNFNMLLCLFSLLIQIYIYIQTNRTKQNKTEQNPYLKFIFQYNVLPLWSFEIPLPSYFQACIIFHIIWLFYHYARVTLISHYSSHLIINLS